MHRLPPQALPKVHSFDQNDHAPQYRWGQLSFRAGDRGSRCSSSHSSLQLGKPQAVRAGLGTGVAPNAWAGAEALALLGP